MQTIIPTTIHNVTVYPDRARVTREGHGAVTTETTQIVVDELPLTLEIDSVRVAGKGSAPVRILGVDIQKRHYRETPMEKVRDLQARIDAIKDELAVLSDEEATFHANMAYLNGLRSETDQFARGLSIGRIKTQDQAELLAFIQERDTALRGELRRVKNEKRELEKTRAQLEAELKQLVSSKPKQRFRATVEVQVLGDGDFRPKLTYVVRKANWQPLYDVRLLDDSLALTALGQITQRTGEDWQDVELTLSTARPALNQRMPDLNPWYIDEAKPMVRAMAMAAPAAPPQAKRVRRREAVASFADVAEEVEAEVVSAEVNTSGTAVTFRIQGNVDIPSDGSAHKTTIAQYDLDPQLDYVAIPKHTDAVFRRVTVRNITPSALLDGSVTLFADDEFIGKNRLKFTPQGDEIELMLGVEDRITVSRELTSRQVDKRFLRDKRTIRYGYKVEVNNLLDKAVTVVIEDHIPVSRHEEIKVRLDSVRPDPQEQTKLNLLKWRRILQPKSKEAVTYNYSVEHPRDMQVRGLLD